MSVIALTGGKAGPGATTAALALGLSWPAPVLLVDADACGGDMVPGMLPGRVGTDRGLLSWLVATRRHTVMEAAQSLAEHVVLLPEAPWVWLMPGVQHGGSRCRCPRAVGNAWLGCWSANPPLGAVP